MDRHWYSRALLILTTVMSAAPSPKEKLPDLLPERPDWLKCLPRHTRSYGLPGLPMRDYQYLTYSQPAIALSQVAVLIEQRQPFQVGVPPAGVPAAGVNVPIVVRERLRFFQLDVAKMQVDHCFLSRVAVTLQENGDWILSLRADQNPWMTGGRNDVSTPIHVRGAATAIQPAAPKLTKETDYLKRNQFFVSVRCYGAYPLKEGAPPLAPGKPVLFELRPAPFWVQRGRPYDLWVKESLPDVRQYFDLIDRVEIEFFYR
jgi:hypothetical protein